MTIDRKTKKDSYFVYQAYWSKLPMVHIAGRRHAQRAGETTEIKVYSNQDTVVLYVNGKEVGQQTAHRVFKFNVALEEGFNTILAVAGDVKDSITLEKVEKEPDCYTLPEFNERQEALPTGSSRSAAGSEGSDGVPRGLLQHQGQHGGSL